jgi:hypothetical protein
MTAAPPSSETEEGAAEARAIGEQNTGDEKNR